MVLSSVPGLAVSLVAFGLCPACALCVVERLGGIYVARIYSAAARAVAIAGTATLATCCALHFRVTSAPMAFQLAVWIVLMCAENYCFMWKLGNGSILEREYRLFVCSFAPVSSFVSLSILRTI